MIFKRYILFAYLFLFIPFYNFAQVEYSDQYADYLLEVKGNEYQVRAVLKNKIQSSRRLQMARNRLRLKAVNLLGNYLVFKSVDIDYPNKDELFDIFLMNSQLSFEAHVEQFKYSSWEQCGASRCIYFSCKKKDFEINSADYSFDLDVSEMLIINFERKRNLLSACRLLEHSHLGLKQALHMEAMFLSGRGALETEFKELLKSNEAYHLQLSLFGNDSLFQMKFYSAHELPMKKNAFGKMVKHRILFTAAPIDEKSFLYEEYLESLSHLDGLWWDMQSFAASKIQTEEFPGWELATVYDVIGHFPLVLNYFNMNIVEQGNDYVRALELFTIEDFDGSLRSLENEINFNGISSASLNLIGATFRLKEEYHKALPYLLLSYQMNPEQMFVRGNIFLCFQALEFPEINHLQLALLEQENLDPWSKNQIENSKINQK
jgi:tetratricopeptide (TPR) repeat protein